MNALEIKLERNGYNFNCKTYPARSNYKFLMSLGRVFPTTKAQARFFISKCGLDVLNMDDVDRVEGLLNKHGLSGKYKYTNSKTWVRLTNQEALREALKKEYSL